jgi:hypothetical protein
MTESLPTIKVTKSPLFGILSLQFSLYLYNELYMGLSGILFEDLIGNRQRWHLKSIDDSVLLVDF